MTEMLNSNKYMATLTKNGFEPSTANFRLFKDGLPRYATVTVYAENGALKYEPVLYSNTPFN